MRAALFAWVLMNFVAVAGVAQAADTWSEPHPGVRLLRRTTPTPWVISALEVDLCRDGVDMRATASAERQRTVSSFGTLVGADAAVNGDFFSFEDYSTTGLAVGAGAIWPGSADSAGTGFLAFGLGRAEVSMPAVVVDPAPAWAADVVSGRIPLVKEGVAVASVRTLSAPPATRAPPPVSRATLAGSTSPWSKAGRAPAWACAAPSSERS